MRWRSIQLRYRYPGASAAVSTTWVTPLPIAAQPHFRPPADVYENDAGLVVRAELGGLSEGAFDVQLYQDALVVEGERPFALGDGRRFYEVGIRSGPFRLEVPLPRPVDGSRVDARYEAGILVVVLPWSAPP
ncbi:MAG: Hsp20/alpha crystallin family protein [Myxococcales bacterium]